ncbi:Putative elongator complex protein 1 [Sporothrix epigloea]|uniref:Elongator complex protein 1 n=1 Tax=Sporothrix epigloea TaxID=1892477 RepID=A0ABP0E5F8_9PEZI
MRNLRNARFHLCRDAIGATAACWDAGKNEVVVAFGPTIEEPRVRLARIVDQNQLNCHDIASWDVLESYPGQIVDRVASLHYFGDLAAVCAIMAGGDIVMIHEESPGSYEAAHIEIVGSVDTGIAAARWSPDEEVLAVVTTSGNLILMSRSFDTISETPLAPADLAASKHVSVGWGKKETQFKGRGAAKALRDPTIPEIIDDGTLSPTDDVSAVTISWRGDGEYVAINSTEAIDNGTTEAEEALSERKRRRVIRVYSREGVLDSASEPVDGLESHLSWRPAGNLLAAVQRKAAFPGRSDSQDEFNIVFFERNGLRHGQFALRLPSTGATEGPTSLDWNTDSTVLAITYESAVQLWTTGNYHWYLKQELNTSPRQPLTLWHPEKPLLLATAASNGLVCAEYIFDTARGSLTPPHDHGSVAVIDGRTIKLTPLRAANMPPPMSLFELPISLPAVDVAFAPQDDVIAVLTSFGLELFTWSWSSPGKRPSKPTALAHLAIGLSRSGHLYANERQLAKNCTSYIVTDDHLVFTTSNHLLKFVHLSEAHDLEVPLDDPGVDERCRNIEQGAQLVTSIPSSLCVVLQMPRGNLETIYPRAMVVSGIRKLIDALDYRNAFAFCRSQRVDMNILYDHKPQQFLENVGKFLEQLNDARNEDVSQTMYKDTKNVKISSAFRSQEAVQVASAPATVSANKVNTICDAVLAELAARRKSNLQNLITAHVSKTPPAIDDGLSMVAQLVGDTATAEARALSARAVEHICFLVDVNLLYKHALGLYDLNLTMLIAQQSLMDPREYIPFIQKLHGMSETWRKFSIDDYLERHEKALVHLADFNDFDKFVEYTGKHRLYTKALSIYRYNSARLAVITNAYAEYLESQSKYREAGLAYESLKNYGKATSCYQSAGVSCWRECLFAAQSQNPPLSSEVFNELASTLIDALLEARDYSSASKIQLEYLDSVEGVRTLCKGYEFAEAIRICSLRRRMDLLQSEVDPGLGDALSSLTELLADCRTQLKSQVPRVLELRRKALEDPFGFYEGERQGGDDVPDDVSIAASSRVSTGASLFTRYSKGSAATGKTGETGGTGTTQQLRNRKKREEKKRARGRKGTVYEQEYLVNSLRRLVERVERARPEVQRLVVGLIRRDMAERARAIETLMADLIEACQVAICEVWQQPGVPGSAQGAPGMMGSILSSGNGDAAQQDDGVAQSIAIAPTIAAFERLSLLG